MNEVALGMQHVEARRRELSVSHRYGHVVLKLKTPWRIRTTHPAMSAREFIQRQSIGRFAAAISVGSTAAVGRVPVEIGALHRSLKSIGCGTAALLNNALAAAPARPPEQGAGG